MMRTARGLLFGWAALLALVALAAVLLADSSRDEPIRASLTLAAALGAGDTVGYARAHEPRAFSFPRDHGPHPEFRTEWWYFTGNLEAEDGTPLGYQLTFFRSALASRARRHDSADANGDTARSRAAEDPNAQLRGRTSAWAADQAFMAHLAVTDAGRARFRAGDRFERAAVGLAGARALPFLVWTGDWSARSIEDDATFPIRLIASHDDVAIDLRIEQGKAPTSQGERGLSRKGPEPGNASYYYSLTRMPTAGTIRIAGESYRVSGASWMDREWSTSALGDDLAGWDWFALQLDDGTDLMVYRLRRHDGSASPFSAGILVEADGAHRTLAEHDVRVEVLDTWASRLDGTPYPARWRLLVPAERIEVEVVPLLPDQELNLAVRYWEGTARVSGTRASAPVRGRAYVELTGYAESKRLTPAGRPAAPSLP